MLRASRALKTQKAFVATVEAWSRVEPIRFGPVAKEHRYERIFYWPDPKGLGTRQIRDALAKSDASVTEEATLAKKSVALQGLPALEYLLYGEAPRTLAKARRRKGLSAAASLRSRRRKHPALATEIVTQWAEGAPEADSYLKPGPANTAYHSAKEVTLELFKALSAGIEWVRDQKLGKMLGAKADEARPRLAPFWRSGQSYANMAGNLQGIIELFTESGFDRIVHEQSAGVEKSIMFDLDHDADVLRGMTCPRRCRAE